MRHRERIKLDPNNPDDMIHAHERVASAKKRLREYSSREIQERARQAALDAMDAMWAIVRSPIAADQAKISAANTIFERAHGKVTQTNINANVNETAAKNINGKSLEQRSAETLQRIEGSEPREGEEVSGENGPTDIRELN
jgi:DNA uptake protein ComE-like DNA-binding protein